MLCMLFILLSVADGKMTSMVFARFHLPARFTVQCVAVYVIASNALLAYGVLSATVSHFQT